MKTPRTTKSKIILLAGFLLLLAAALLLTGCFKRQPKVASVASDNCVACHTNPEIITSLAAAPAAGPTESTGG